MNTLPSISRNSETAPVQHTLSIEHKITHGRLDRFITTYQALGERALDRFFTWASPAVKPVKRVLAPAADAIEYSRPLAFLDRHISPHKLPLVGALFELPRDRAERLNGVVSIASTERLQLPEPLIAPLADVIELHPEPYSHESPSPDITDTA